MDTHSLAQWTLLLTALLTGLGSLYVSWRGRHKEVAETDTERARANAIVLAGFESLVSSLGEEVKRLKIRLRDFDDMKNQVSALTDDLRDAQRHRRECDEKVARLEQRVGLLEDEKQLLHRELARLKGRLAEREGRV